MAEITIELRTIIEQMYINKFNKQSTLRPMDTIKQVYDMIFDFDFPLFDEGIRKDLCSNWLLHFYFNEIGLETYGRWKTCLESRFLDIMPYINDMASNQIEIEDMYYNKRGDTTVKWNMNRQGNTENVYERDSTSNNTTTNNTDTSSNTQTSTHNETSDYLRHSDTPQNGLEDVQAGRYLTSADVNNGDADASGTNNTSGTTEENGSSNSTINDSSTDSTDSSLEEVGNRNITEKYQTVPSVDIFGKYKEVYFNILNELYRLTSDLFITIY